MRTQHALAAARHVVYQLHLAMLVGEGFSLLDSLLESFRNQLIDGVGAAPSSPFHTLK